MLGMVVGAVIVVVVIQWVVVVVIGFAIHVQE